MPDRHLNLRQPRPETLPHLTADLAVQLRDSVGVGSHPQRQDRHPERLALVGRVLAAECQHLLTADSQPSYVFSQIAIDQMWWKGIVTSDDRRVGREHQSSRRCLTSLGERQLTIMHQLADSLKRQEGGMALVH